MLKLVFLFLFFYQIKAETSSLNNGQIKKTDLASTAFYEACDSFETKKYDKAYKNFLKLYETVNEEIKPLTLFNAALCLEKQKKYNEALKLYESIGNKDTYKFLQKDSYYRMTAVCHELKDPSCIIKNLSLWKKSEQKLSLAEDFEFMVRTGLAYYDLNSLLESIKYLKSAIYIYRDKYSFLIKNAESLKLTQEKINQLSLWSYETLAKAYIGTGNKISLSFRTTSDQRIIREGLENSLNLKAFYYVKAQDTYLEMMRLGDRLIASKGLFEIGKMYKEIYLELLNSEIPASIIKNDVIDEYKIELKKELSPLLSKAKISFIKNLEYAKTFKYSNEWTEKTNKELNELNKL